MRHMCPLIHYPKQYKQFNRNLSSTYTCSGTCSRTCLGTCTYRPQAPAHAPTSPPTHAHESTPGHDTRMHLRHLHPLQLLHRGSEGAGAKARSKLKIKLLVEQHRSKDDGGPVHDDEPSHDAPYSDQDAMALDNDAASLPHDIKSEHQVKRGKHSTMI